MVPHTERKWPAVKRLGTMGASAFHTRSVAYSMVSQYVETGAGFSAVKMVRGGQMTWGGRKTPSLAGKSGSVTAFQAARTAECRPVVPQFTGPGTCPELPLKSQMNASSVMVTFTRTSKGPLPPWREGPCLY